MELINFKLGLGAISNLFIEKGAAMHPPKAITEFKDACFFIKQLPYGRNSDKTDLKLIFSEKKGTCSP